MSRWQLRWFSNLPDIRQDHKEELKNSFFLFLLCFLYLFSMTDTHDSKTHAEAYPSEKDRRILWQFVRGERREEFWEASSAIFCASGCYWWTQSPHQRHLETAPECCCLRRKEPQTQRSHHPHCCAPPPRVCRLHPEPDGGWHCPDAGSFSCTGTATDQVTPSLC